MSQSLVDVNKEMFDLFARLNEIEELGETVPKELAERVNQLLEVKAEKVDRYVAFERFCKSQAEWLRSEKKVLDAEIKRIDRTVERLKSAALLVMSSTGECEILGKAGHKFLMRESSSVKITDITKVPEEFRRTTISEDKITIEADKNKIKDAFKKGLLVEGAGLETETYVQFK